PALSGTATRPLHDALQISVVLGEPRLGIAAPRTGHVLHLRNLVADRVGVALVQRVAAARPRARAAGPALCGRGDVQPLRTQAREERKGTRLNSSHVKKAHA